jgi:LacI family transcriptional regulator
VTRADVARYAGVSTAVVSYVVNNGPKAVAPETAARVREAVELLDYRPNVNAQALRRGTNEMIGLVLSDPNNPFFTEFAAAIAAEAFEYGHALMIATARASEDTERRLIDDLVRRQVDGLIVASLSDRPDLRLGRKSRKANIVWIDAWSEVPGYASLGTRGQEGSRLAVEHLVQVHGHSSVGLLIGHTGSGATDPRERGWRDALRAAGLADGPIGRGDWSREGGYVAGRRLLEALNPPTAIFAGSDLQAVGLLRAAHEGGLRIPEELAVVGFDGTRESAYCWPPLTVLAQPVEAMAKAAVALVLSEERRETYLQFDGTLITRRSCGCSEPLPAMDPTGDRSVQSSSSVAG